MVGIGASAGGLETFTELLKALPADTGVDFVLSPEELAKELAWIGRHPYVVRQKEADVVPEGEEDLLSRVFILLRSAVGVDFTYYKHTTICCLTLFINVQ